VERKKVYLICQSKGGTGKSFLAFLLYHHTIEREDVHFLDWDFLTPTISRKLPASKVTPYAKIITSERSNGEAVLDGVEWASKYGKDQTFLMDMGVRESAELIRTLTKIAPAKEIKSELEQMLNVDLHFEVVIAGKHDFFHSYQYLQKLQEATDDLFPVRAWANVRTFHYADMTGLYETAVREAMAQWGYFGSTSEPDDQLASRLQSEVTIPMESLTIRDLVTYQRLMAEVKTFFT
jgi:hypothetical protein